ncbi:tetratricopeptide repeat protein [Azospirillum sp.]|uniref:O-linked N-acetylglucosamine transferase, SPINDLY family protein n=1 Tax=Azospirillum sp. TaxID=34012 RepID=UPI002D72D1F9|nr:tetratricopeptide repeat protein [Azospirillum sp.]HYD69448.1 tetratricopeptide repeat protein [Azospirillum sp.]
MTQATDAKREILRSLARIVVTVADAPRRVDGWSELTPALLAVGQTAAAAVAFSIARRIDAALPVPAALADQPLLPIRTPADQAVMAAMGALGPTPTAEAIRRGWQACLLAGWWEEGWDLLNQMGQRFPDDPEVLSAFCLLSALLGRPEAVRTALVRLEKKLKSTLWPDALARAVLERELDCQETFDFWMERARTLGAPAWLADWLALGGRESTGAAEIATYREAHPDSALAWHHSALAAKAAGDPAAAEAACHQALGRAPTLAPAWLLLADLKWKGAPFVALTACLAAVAAWPRTPRPVAKLAECLLDLDAETGLAFCEQVLQRFPTEVAAHELIGQALRLRYPERAAAMLAAAVSRFPHEPGVHLELAHALSASGRWDDALVPAQRAALLAPGRTPVWTCLSLVAWKAGDWKLAHLAARQGLETATGSQAHLRPGCWAKLANVVFYECRYGEAEALVRRALAEDTDTLGHEAGKLLLNILLEQARLAEARALAADLRSRHPRDPQLAGQFAIISSRLGEWDEVEAALACALTESASLPLQREELWELVLYLSSYHPELPAADIAGRFLAWGREKEAPWPQPAVLPQGAQAPAAARGAQGRIRVGVLSPDFRQHTSHFYFEPLFRELDRDRFELVAVSNVAQPDNMTAAMRRHFAHWLDIQPLSDDRAAAAIGHAGIDVLIDACNHMRDTRTNLLVRRLAPVQMTWLGSAWTSGLSRMDYVVMDRHLVPEGADALFSEKVIRLPNSIFCYQQGDAATETGPVERRKDEVVFGYYGRTERLNRRVFAAWAKILNALPGASMVFDYHCFADPVTRDDMRARLARHGFPMDRVRLQFSRPVLPAFSQMDIQLDPFPHSGGTVLFDSLWMGVPFVSLASRPPVGRFGASMLANLGLSDWIAQTEEEYVRLAVAKAGDRAALASLRQGLRQRLLDSPVCDAGSFARGFGAAMEAVFRRAMAGLPPAPIDIGPDGAVTWRE